MLKLHTNWRRLLAVALLALPLLQTSCMEVAQRAAINGFFDAVTPVLDTRLHDRLTALFGQLAGA